MQTNIVDSSKPLTWKRSIILSCLVLVASTAFGLWKPIWVAPPRFYDTMLMYLALIWMWMPVLVVCALRRPVGGWLLPLFGTIGIVLVSLLISFLIFTSFIPTLRPFFVLPLDAPCSSSIVAPNWVQYTCVATGVTGEFVGPAYRYTLTLEGLPNFPLVRLTGHTVTMVTLQ